MNVYEAIIIILEKKGPATIPFIWEEITKLTSEEKTFFNVSHLKSIIGLKREWFVINDDLVSLRPERDLVKLTFTQSGYPGPEVKVRVDFKRNTFVFQEWYYDRQDEAPTLPHFKPGKVCDFKNALYSMQIWDWERDYQSDGIIVDGLSWSIVLETKGGVYRTEGLDSFPKGWRRFYRSLVQLTGVRF